MAIRARCPSARTPPRQPSSPYGFTKMAGEQILEQLGRVDPRWQFGILRYFNPAGAHPSGRIGEDPAMRPANLVPYMAKVALGEFPEVAVFGNDYATPDGTGVRDYIHVSDLAEGHVLSLRTLLETRGSHLVNLGTGRGHSVLEVIRAYSEVLRPGPALQDRRRDARATSRPPMPMWGWPARSWASRRSAIWPRCAARAGPGSRTTGAKSA